MPDSFRPGIGNSAAFQVSGWPFVTSSVLSAASPYFKVTLPSVAKSFTIRNCDQLSVSPFVNSAATELLVFFGPDLTGAYPPPQVVKNHFISIPISGSFKFDVKCSQFFVAMKNPASAGAFQAIAELTNCDIVDLWYSSGTTNVRDGQLTGSGINL